MPRPTFGELQVMHYEPDFNTITTSCGLLKPDLLRRDYTMVPVRVTCENCKLKMETD